MWIVWVAKVRGACIDSEELLTPWLPVAWVPTKLVADTLAHQLNTRWGAAAGSYEGWLASVARVGRAPAICS
jgi:hypothetical protein